MNAGWTLRASDLGGLDFLECIDGRKVVRFIPSDLGSQVDLSTDGGETWTHSKEPARSIAQAERLAGWMIDRLRYRAARPARVAPRPESEGARGRSIRTWEEAPPAGIRFDDPTSVDLARQYVSRARPSVRGENGSGSLFAVSVALVRGYALLPDGYAGVLLAEYNASAEPPWTAHEMRRALVNAEANGRMPWGVLLFAALRRGRGVGRGNAAR